MLEIYFSQAHFGGSETVEVRYAFMEIYPVNDIIYSIPSVSALGKEGTRFASKAALPRCR